jgi:hypothetical protein
LEEQKALQISTLQNTLSSIVAGIKMIDVGHMVLEE